MSYILFGTSEDNQEHNIFQTEGKLNRRHPKTRGRYIGTLQNAPED